MRRFLRAAGTPLLAALVLLGGGCGGGSSTVAVSPTPTVAVPPPSNPIDQVPVSDTVQAPGLGAQTDVVYDDLGMPHIYSSDAEAAIFVQGYVTAQARFWQMDMFRRVAEGRLSEVFGRATVNSDIGMRTVFTTRDGRRLEEALWEYVQQVDPDLARLSRAYAAGVNLWLADLRAGRNGATLPPEYTTPYLIDLEPKDLVDWRPQDSFAIARLQAYSLSQSMDSEIALARSLATLPDAIFRDVFRAAPAAPATVLPPATPRSGGASLVVTPSALPSVETLAAVADNLAELHRINPFGTMAEGAGSNNWIVSPALSANGHAMLANDPHLALFNPPIWHLVQIDAAEETENAVRATGVIFPGIAGVILGLNDHGAWGGTVAYFDVTDVYVETVTTPPDYPASPRTVLFKGQQVPVLRLEEQIGVKNAAPVTTVVEVVPHHGPMVPDPNLRDTVVGLAATNLTVRWTGHELTNDTRFLVDLDRAKNVTDFRTALRNFAVGAQNWVWADVNGDIAYFARALVPQRPAGVVPYLPMPGTGEAEWLSDDQGQTRWLPEDKLPQATNPAAGFLATANNDQTGATLDNDPLNDDVYLAYGYDLGFRAERIRELLTNSTGGRPTGTKISAADMARYQYDMVSKEAARLVPFLLAAAEARPDLVTPDMAAALDRLEAWGTSKPGSPAFDAVSGIDAHDLRADCAPRSEPVSDEERADAVATSVFAAWTTRLARAVLGDEFSASGLTSPGGADATKAMLHILEDVDRDEAGFRVYTRGADGQSTLWDNTGTPAAETRDEVLLTALRDGLGFLDQTFAGAEPESWLWGKIHQVRYQHFIGQAGIPVYDLGPFAAPGARFTVNPANYSLNGDTFTFSSGPSKRFVAVLDPQGVRAVNIIPGGTNGNPGGTAQEKYNEINPALHYGDHIPGWINGQTFAYRLTRADVADHAVRKVRFSPN